MKRYLKSAVATLLLIIFIVSSYLPVVAVGQPTTYSKTSNSGQRDVICTSLDDTSAGSYYTGNYDIDSLVELSSSQLLTSLRTLMTSTHSKISSYDDCHYKADMTDCENNNGKVLLLYTSYSATMNQWNGWNREHVWPQSLGGNNTNGGGADLHHIRPSDAVVNSTRGNKKYGEADSGSSVYGKNPASGYLGGKCNTYFEPNDNVKGDVARICLYVWVRWGSAWGANNITQVFQSVDVLLEWCALDPVDTWEMGRNEVVQNIQGNRNVFIDYPELAWLLFDEEIPADMTTPSGMAGEIGTGSMGGGSSDSSCSHENTMIKNAISATCTTDGYTGDTYCSDCGKKIKDGSVISSDNAHSFGQWTPTDDGSTYVRFCSKCQEQQTLTVNSIISSIETDAEKILILLALGINDSLILGELSN